MRKKDTTKRKRPAPSRAALRDELGKLIYKVLHHPALPQELRSGFYGAINDLQNTLDLTEICYNPHALTRTLELYDKEKGGAR